MADSTKSFSGVTDSRPCSSTDGKAQEKPRSADIGDWRGVQDGRVKSSTGSSPSVKSGSK